VKLISLRFKAFGAYLEEQFIDFEQLYQTGLFLISGKTGAGKTVILDAITYSLYGKSSGGGRGDIFAMRCQFAAADNDTEVELIFEVRGKKYKFIRKLQQKRVNLTSTQNAFFMTECGEYTPFFENPHLKDVEEKAIELIGLNYEQFRQVVILPQGQFEKLLVAKSEEKEKILVSLFDAQKWQTAANSYYEIINEKKRQLESLKLKLTTMLENIGCSTLEELDALICEKEDIYSKNTEKTKSLEEKYSALKEELESAATILEKYETISKAEERIRTLSGIEEEMRVSAKRADKAKAAAKVTPIYDKNCEYKLLLAKKKEVIAQKKKEYDDTVKESIKVKNLIHTLEEKAPENEENKARIKELEGMENTYEHISSLKQALKIKTAKCKEIENNVMSYRLTVQKKHDECMATEKELVQLYDEYSVLLSQYMGGISSVLAAELKENKPCPVCGSLTHPKPAEKTDSYTDRTLLESKDSEIKKKTMIRDELKSELAKQENILNDEETKLQEILLEIAGEEAVISNLSMTFETGFEDIDYLHKEIIRLKENVRLYDKELTEAIHTASKVESLIIEIKTSIRIGEEDYENTLNASKENYIALTDAIIVNGFKDESDYLQHIMEEAELNMLQSAISDYNSELTQLRSMVTQIRHEVKESEIPDINLIRNNFTETQKQILEVNKESVLLESEIKQAKEAQEYLTKKFSEFIIEDEQNKKNLIFARRMRGDNGVGIQRYLLGVVLSHITTEANRLLASVHGGRYRILRTLEKSGASRKSGLELEVFDSFSGERRSVSTLSGGEKFLVSLSLSIGLSTVVQAESSGIKIETMFIDEGFGSLDTASISDALTVLGKMNNAGCLIGIISHVDELKDNIFTQIEVKKECKGSRIIVHL